MSAAYVRRMYGVPARRGMRVTVDGGRYQGEIVSFPDAYLGVRLDGEKTTSRFHPTWRITYHVAPGRDVSYGAGSEA